MHIKHPPLLKSLKNKMMLFPICLYVCRNYLHITELFSYDYLHIYTKGICLLHSYCLANRPR